MSICLAHGFSLIEQKFNDSSLAMFLQDLPFVPKYLVTFTVGFEQRDMVNAAISKVDSTSYVIIFELRS